MKYFPNGMGAASGGSLVVAKNLNTTGDVWYVDFTNGVDAVSPAGLSRYNPLKTVAQAITNAADENDIVFLPNHAETLTAVQNVAKKIRFHSEGTGAARARFTRNAAAAILFNVTGARCEFRDLYFVQSAQANAAARVTIGAGSALFKNCYFECGASDTGPAVDLITAADRTRFEGNTFISVSTTTRPSMALRLSNAMTDIRLDGDVFDGGTVGWSNQYALDATAAIITDIRAEALSLLRDSDIGLINGSSGFFQIGVASGSSRVVHL